MGAGVHGGFGATMGNKTPHFLRYNLQFFGSKAFEEGGHVSKESFEGHREFFLGKSIKRLKHEMTKLGYKVKIEPSKHPLSKAKKIIVLNTSKEKNVTVVHVSPGSKRHGETAYVRVCTNDVGKLKVVADISKYKTDGKENSLIYPARSKKND